MALSGPVSTVECVYSVHLAFLLWPYPPAAQQGPWKAKVAVLSCSLAPSKGPTSFTIKSKNEVLRCTSPAPWALPPPLPGPIPDLWPLFSSNSPSCSQTNCTSSSLGDTAVANLAMEMPNNCNEATTSFQSWMQCHLPGLWWTLWGRGPHGPCLLCSDLGETQPSGVTWPVSCFHPIEWAGCGAVPHW